MKKCIDANSAFIAKNSTKFFPITPSHGSLEVKHGDRPASHCAAMTAAMSKIKKTAIACVQSQRGACYFVRTCGTADAHEDQYLANFEDVFGDEVKKLIGHQFVNFYMKFYQR